MSTYGENPYFEAPGSYFYQPTPPPLLPLHIISYNMLTDDFLSYKEDDNEFIARRKRVMDQILHLVYICDILLLQEVPTSFVATIYKGVGELLDGNGNPMFVISHDVFMQYFGELGKDKEEKPVSLGLVTISRNDMTVRNMTMSFLEQFFTEQNVKDAKDTVIRDNTKVREYLVEQKRLSLRCVSTVSFGKSTLASDMNFRCRDLLPRVQLLKFTSRDGYHFIIVNVHMTFGDDSRQANEMGEILKFRRDDRSKFGIAGLPVMFMGDFNIIDPEKVLEYQLESRLTKDKMGYLVGCEPTAQEINEETGEIKHFHTDALFYTNDLIPDGNCLPIIDGYAFDPGYKRKSGILANDTFTSDHVPVGIRIYVPKKVPVNVNLLNIGGGKKKKSKKIGRLEYF